MGLLGDLWDYFVSSYNNFYRNIVIPMANEKTLPLLTTIITILATIFTTSLAVFIAYKNYKAGEWKAKLSIDFGFQRESAYNRIITTSLIRSKYTNTSAFVTSYNPELMDVEDRHKKYKEWSFPVAYDAITIARIQIRNTGRGDLRFSAPIFGHTNDFSLIDYIECRKNGKLVGRTSEKDYFELKSGEVFDFYYNIVDLAKVSKNNFNAIGLALLLDKIGLKYNNSSRLHVSILDNRGKK
jgi:hypothetical protein